MLIEFRDFGNIYVLGLRMLLSYFLVSMIIGLIVGKGYSGITTERLLKRDCYPASNLVGSPATGVTCLYLSGYPG